MKYSSYLFFFLIFCMMSCSSSKTVVKRSSSSSSRVVTTSSITKEARRWIKKPYKYGGESPAGFDCSGLVQYVYAQQGVQLPRRSADQARYGKSVSIKEAKQGDLIFFKSGGRVSHVGIVSDTKGKYPSMIHASSSRGVSEVDLDYSEYWRKKYAYIRRP